MRIPIDITGDILNLPRAELSVRVADDVENTGGYLVYEWWVESGGPNLKGAFDSWCRAIRAAAVLPGFGLASKVARHSLTARSRSVARVRFRSSSTTRRLAGPIQWNKRKRVARQRQKITAQSLRPPFGADQQSTMQF